jgi:uroporphyrinogen-III decarboxylase
MTPKERMLVALDGGMPDRLPVTTHFLMPHFLQTSMDGMSEAEFFDACGWDPIMYTTPHRPDPARGEYYDPEQGTPGFLESRRIATDHWRVHCEAISGPNHPTTRYRFVTPKGTLSMVLEADPFTAWVVEPLVKEKRDIDLIGEYVTAPKCDVEAVNREAEAFGQRGLLRGYICCFDVFGQPGVWQDATCLVGLQRLIMESYDDPAWVHELLGILLRRKMTFVESLAGARYDILELGGGGASSTVISPRLFDEFVAPYDSQLIAAAHRAGQRIAYHTCGGMMAILGNVVAMNPNAMETFTPPGMGGDANLAEARRRIPQNICMIGGFDQFHFFKGCSAQETRTEVRRCFEAAGHQGSYILCPSDNFFEAEPDLVRAFADEARKCVYPVPAT